MNKHLTALNITYAIVDMVVCLGACAVFFFTARHFDRWWITLFSIVPLLAFNAHSLVLDDDIKRAEEEGNDA